MMVSVEKLRDELAQLSASEKAKLIEYLSTALQRDLEESEKRPKTSLYSLIADLGAAPSNEDIDEIRQEMWSDFPREDI